MMRFDPFREIEELNQRVDRMFGQGGNSTPRYAPTVDVHEDDQGLEIGLDLPGVRAEDISVEAENNTLTVQAERKYNREEGRTAHRVERAYGQFTRSFSVPAKYDLSKIEASFDNGSLTITIPRSEAAQKRAITVKSGSNKGGNKTVDAKSNEA